MHWVHLQQNSELGTPNSELGTPGPKEPSECLVVVLPDQIQGIPDVAPHEAIHGLDVWVRDEGVEWVVVDFFVFK